jgi:hypothetical protein
MTRDQIGITVGTVGFLACTGVFVVCFLKQLAYVEVLSGSGRLGRAFGCQCFRSRGPCSRPLEDNQLKSGFPSLAGSALAFFVLAFYALSGFPRGV